MQTITTSKGKTYEVDYAWAPLFDGSCRIAIHDSRLISEIAPEFEELTSIHYSNPGTSEIDWIGYNKLIAVSMQGDSLVEIVLMRGDSA